MDHTQLDGDRRFFAASQCGCWLLMIALAIVAAGSGYRVVQPERSSTYEGELREVSVRQSSPWRARYNVVLQREDGELVTLRVRNQGAILGYLEAASGPERVQVTARDGVVQRLVLADGEVIAEPEAAEVLMLAAVVLPLAVLALLAWPWVVERRAAGARQPAAAGEEEE
ncbi:MAG: hypothetical protein RRC07_08880 [Anaerolineae bacterium]|nr:hypothetical protein [Anaerolineae bacterium]